LVRKEGLHGFGLKRKRKREIKQELTKMLQRAASNAYSWWWASHIRTKQSKWLEQNLQGNPILLHQNIIWVFVYVGSNIDLLRNLLVLMMRFEPVPLVPCFDVFWIPDYF
jgi:hypothetical protein